MLHSQSGVEAILHIGSTVSRSLADWDDIDITVFVNGDPKERRYYEIIKDGRKHYLLSAVYFHLDKLHTPATNVLQQRDVRILFGSEESLRHLFIKKPRRIEPLPHQIQNFKENYENYFMLLVDLFFILKRYEARGRRDATKSRLCRDAMRTIARHYYYEFYGVSRPIRDRERWRKVLGELLQFLDERKFEDICKNKNFVRDSIGFMSEYGASV